MNDVRSRYTAIETRNRELVIVPNSWLMKNSFSVIRAPSDEPLAWRRALTFNIDAGADPTNVTASLERAVLDSEIPHVLKQPAPSAILAEVASGYCRYTLRYWLADPRHDDPSDSAVRIHALAALTRAGVQLGLPKEERLTIKENASWRAAAAQRESELRINAIRRTQLFAQLPPAEQEALASHLVHAPFASGDVMTHQGAVAHWLYLIIQGEAKVLVTGPNGPVQVAALHDGDFFGEMGMLTGEARRATVVALTAVDCYRLNKDGFAEVLQQRPELAREVSAIVDARNAELGTRLDQSGLPSPEHGDLLTRVLKFFPWPPESFPDARRGSPRLRSSRLSPSPDSASRASTITRSTGSVPLARISTRPWPSSSASAALRLAAPAPRSCFQSCPASAAR